MGSKKKAKPCLSGPVRLAVSDGLMMALWALCSSVFGELAEVASLQSGLDEFMMNIAVLIVALILVTWMCERFTFFSGALFNPCNNAALYVSGREPLLTSMIRMLGQLAGAVAGSLAAWYFVPISLQGKFHYLAGGLKDGVMFLHGIASEACLGFFLNIIFLWCMDTENKTIVFWVPLINTVINCVVGSYFTGPSLNPYLSFSWNFIHQTHSLEEHVVIFHLAPFVGAILAGFLYRFATTKKTKKKSRKSSKNTKSTNSSTKSTNNSKIPTKADVVSAPTTPMTTGARTRSQAAQAAASAQKPLTQNSVKGSPETGNERKKTK